MPPTLGQRLRRARDERGWLLEEISHRTRIPLLRLRELEEDNLNGCGGMTYAKSFLRTYSEALGVDASDVLQQMHAPPLGGVRDYRYLVENHGHWVDDYRNTPAMEKPVARRFPGSRSFGVLAVVFLVALVLGVTLWPVRAWNNPKINKSTVLEAVKVAPPAASKPPEAPVKTAALPAIEVKAPTIPEGDEFMVLGLDFNETPAPEPDLLKEFRDRPAQPSGEPPPKAQPVR